MVLTNIMMISNLSASTSRLKGSDMAEKKAKRQRTPIGPEDGERVLSLCLKKLKLLSPEWRRWVVKCIDAYGEVGAKQQLKLLDDAEIKELI